MRKPDSMGEYFFDRSPLIFDSILNFYRTGKLLRTNSVSMEALLEEAEFWQIPFESTQDEKLGDRLARTSIEVLHKKVFPIFEKIKGYIVERIQAAAQEAVQSFSIEFKV